MKLPITEILKSIPSVFGIRLDEEPKYAVVEKDGPFEIRRYEPIIVAKIKVKGDHKKATEQGFKKLASYIFGNNTKSKSMAMTVPVYKENKNEKMAMTVPVYQESKQINEWVISFVMSSKYSMQSLPKPNDKNIELVSIPEKIVAVLQYSGENNPEKMKLHQAELDQWIKQSSHQQLGPATYAQYDAPFVIPFLKRNEVQIELQTSATSKSTQH